MFKGTLKFSKNSVKQLKSIFAVTNKQVSFLDKELFLFNSESEIKAEVVNLTLINFKIEYHLNKMCLIGVFTNLSFYLKYGEYIEIPILSSNSETNLLPFLTFKVDEGITLNGLVTSM